MRECKRCVDCGIRWKQPRKSRCTRCDRVSRGLSPDGQPLQVEPIGQRVINGMEFDVVFDGSVR